MTKVMITNDVFDIAKRIKEIDDNYFVIYDRRLCRFEIHNKRQRPDTLALVLPYDKLDYRAIDKVLSTRTEYIAKRLDEIDKFNQTLEESQKRLALQKRLQECQEVLHRPSV